jgi:hypothetical protein
MIAIIAVLCQVIWQALASRRLTSQAGPYGMPDCSSQQGIATVDAMSIPGISMIGGETHCQRQIARLLSYKVPASRLVNVVHHGHQRLPQSQVV